MSMDLCRPFLSSAPEEGCDCDLAGLTGPACSNRSCCIMMNMGDLYNAAAGSGGAGEPVDLRRKQQPFNMSATSCDSVFKSPGGTGMAGGGSSMGFFPYTNAQWNELERQAMVFKYMMHSIPVPHEHLLPFIATRNLSDLSGGRDSHLLKILQNGDPEPGRCRRTDGKKWRCSNSVAPDQKYCAKHLHRGRPRSRKHVEAAATDLIKSNKKTLPCSSTTFFKQRCSSFETVRVGSQNGSRLEKAQFPGSATGGYNSTFQFPCGSIDRSSSRASVSAVLPQTHSRKVDGPEQPWCQLMQSKVGLTLDLKSHFQQQLPMSLLNSSYTQFSSSQDHHQQQPKQEFELFLNPELTSLKNQSRCSLIDAWDTDDNNNSTSNNSHDSVSLGLSMGNGYNDENENKEPHIGNWLTQSGGPLGEMLRPTSAAAATAAEYEDSCYHKIPQQVSSPSGILQRAAASLSDSTNNSSTQTLPRQAKTGFQWLSQDKVSSSC